MSEKYARHRAREFALQGIYQWLLSHNSLYQIEQHFREVSGFNKINQVLFSGLLRGSVENHEVLQNTFAPFLSRKPEELSPIEHAILLLATYELETYPETPFRVVLNEAIELAKAYGGTDGHRFINGVLDKLVVKIRAIEINGSASPELSDK